MRRQNRGKKKETQDVTKVRILRGSGISHKKGEEGSSQSNEGSKSASSRTLVDCFAKRKRD